MPPLQDALDRTPEGRSRLRLHRRVPQPPDQVWPALTEPAAMSRWYPCEVAAEDGGPLRTGAGLVYRFAGTDIRMTGRVRELTAPRRAALEWGAELLDWELCPDGDSDGWGSVLTLTHTFDDHFGAASFAAGWSACMERLSAVAAGEDPGPLPGPGELEQVHERYVRDFDLTEGAAGTGPDGGWEVRFERQLVRPADVAWASFEAAPDVDGALFPLGDRLAHEPFGLLEYAWLAGGRPVGRVRWQLGAGTGQGARLVLTVTGSAEHADRRADAMTAGRTRIEYLAERLLDG
ncbi:SRPBCC domain-containing protein [Streptomyces sp. ODS28]|uniref:SRPBCC domain-containing protein n=1 Tax=Streptomyces sp. ODS28 TaxID=3136688 RepID=UPI0031EF9424